ncbi:response regulator transcription factor [Chloroflexota bacterium]
MKRTLSPLQNVVTELLCKGFSTKEVADNLQISESTAQNIISMIMLKTNCRTRAELAAKAVTLSLVKV